MYISGESAIHDACSQYNTSQFQAERGIFQEDVRKRVVQKYDKVSCDVTDLQVSIYESTFSTTVSLCLYDHFP